MQSILADNELLAAISRQWGLAFVNLRSDISLAGSPERTVWRRVVESEDGRQWVLEKIASRKYARKRYITGILQDLYDQGIHQITPYRADRDGDTIPVFAHGLWQICPFVQGLDLKRPYYVMDGWRGDAAADFLIRLKSVGIHRKAEVSGPAFSLPDYIRHLFDMLARNDAGTATAYHPFLEHLDKSLFRGIDRIPTRFCHGDYHPLNMIWGTDNILAVIDWEFCGIKPESYDLANLLGCLGIEDPQSLWGPFVGRLVDRLRAANFMAAESWKRLPEVIMAIRFAWLSEWMRKNDRAMIQMEADYMALLFEHQPFLRSLFLGR